MIAMCEQPSPLDLWRKRLGGRRHRRTQPRPLAALGYLTHGPVIDGLVEVEHLTLVLLDDEQLRPGYCALRLAGFSGCRVPWGVRWGGPGQCELFKDLRLQPVPGGRGYRLDLADEELLVLGLTLDRELDRHLRHRRHEVRQHVGLPKLWAAFRREEAPQITGEGPELAAYATRIGRSPRQVLEHLRREHQGQLLLPLAWTSHHWQQALAVYADLKRFPLRQVFHLRHLPDDLVGYQDAAEFNLYDGRLSTLPTGAR